MNLKKTSLACGLVLVLSVSFIASQVIGGIEPPPDPASEKIVGPEMWAVGVIMNCETGDVVATLRVKKIEDCEVDTDPQKIVDLTACPTSKADILWFRLDQGSVFGICNFANHEPIITRVKNFKNEGDVISFDAQIKFVVPGNVSDDVCEP